MYLHVIVVEIEVDFNVTPMTKGAVIPNNYAFNHTFGPVEKNVTSCMHAIPMPHVSAMNIAPVQQSQQEV